MLYQHIAVIEIEGDDLSVDIRRFRNYIHSFTRHPVRILHR